MRKYIKLNSSFHYLKNLLDEKNEDVNKIIS